MDATAEGHGLLKEAIRPPRPEDAGLEDCALTPDAIREAFSKAADYVKSRIIDDDDDDGCWVEDASPSNGEVPDALVGPGETPTKPLCGGAGKKSSFPAGEEAGRVGDVVVVAIPGDIEGDTSPDKVVVSGGEDGVGSGGGGVKTCVGEEAQKGDDKKKNHGEKEEDDGDGEGKLILGEVLI